MTTRTANEPARPVVRDARPADFDAIARIYAHYVENARRHRQDLKRL